MQQMQLHGVENNLEHSFSVFVLLWAGVHEREVKCGLEADSHQAPALKYVTLLGGKRGYRVEMMFYSSTVLFSLDSAI